VLILEYYRLIILRLSCYQRINIKLFNYNIVVRYLFLIIVVMMYVYCYISIGRKL